MNEQTVVDKEYLTAALDRFELEYVEMAPGDALVFDCNLLHRSDAEHQRPAPLGILSRRTTAVEDGAVPSGPRGYGVCHELVPVPAGAFMDLARGWSLPMGTYPAVVLPGLGETPAIREVTVDPPGSGEVLVRVMAAGVCRTDLAAVRDARRCPVVLGHEGAGRGRVRRHRRRRARCR